MSAILKTQRLEELHSQITQNAGFLYENLTLAVFAEDEAAFLHAIENSVIYIEDFTVVAEQYHGLVKIADFLKQNLQALSFSQQTEKSVICSQIEYFPYLISNYLYNPTNEVNRNALVLDIKQGKWISPITDDELQKLSSLLGDNFTIFDSLTNAQLDNLNLFEDQKLEEQSKQSALDSMPLNQQKIQEPAISEMADSEIIEQIVSDEKLLENKALNRNLTETNGWVELSNQMVEIVDHLAQASHKLITAEVDSDEFLESLEEYTDIVQKLWEKAETQGLGGIQTICTFINDNVFELSSKPQLERLAVHEELAIWPQLVLDYLQTSEAAIAPLVSHLKSSSWCQPLSVEPAKALATQLMQDFVLAQMQNSSMQAKEQQLPQPIDDLQQDDTEVALNIGEVTEAESESDQLIVADDFYEAELTDIEPIANQVNLEINEQIIANDELNNEPTYAIDNEAFVLLRTEAIEVSSEFILAINEFSQSSEEISVQEAAEQCIEYAQGLEDAAGMVNLVGLHVVCQHFTQHIQILSLELPKERANALTLLQGWFTHLQNYLDYPVENAEQLVRHLMDETWPQPLDSEQANLLLIQLGSAAVQTVVEEVESASSQAATEPEAVESIDIETIVADSLDEVSDSLVNSELDKETITTETITIETVSTDVLPPISTDNGDETESTPEQPITLANPDILAIVIDQITESNTELTQHLLALIEAEDDSEALLGAVETYTETVQAVWDTAEMAQLVGVQDVCTFINDNVMGLGMQSQAERLQSSELFSEWPAFTLEYLQQPTPSHVQNLLAHLQQTGWSMPLEVEQAERLYQRLLMPAVVEGDDNAQQVEVVDEIPTTDIVLASPDILELLIAQISDTEIELNTQLEVLTSTEDGSEALLTAVEAYTESVQGIWDAADMAGLQGVQDVCGFINDNIMGLSMQAQAERETAKPLFSNWLVHLNGYLQSPTIGASELVTHLQHSQWAMPMEAEQAEVLQQTLLTPAASVGETDDAALASNTSSTDFYLADPDILELIRNQIGDVTAGLSAALEECISMDNDNPAFFEAIENYTNQVQAIWDAADMAGLSGLQEVCTFVNDNLMALSAQQQAEKLQAKGQFEQWPNLVLAYLHDPLSAAPPLVESLQTPDWPQPLAAEQAASLLAQLTQPAASNAEIAASEPEIMAEPEPTEPVEDLPGLEVEQGNEISLGSAEVLEILTGELGASKEELAEELARFVNAKPGDAALEEGAENYGDIVMRLYAAAEMLGLEGLQKVCEFIVENAKAAGTADQAARTKAKPVFENWPDLVLAYLEAPVDHVITLLNNFREPQWLKPLADEQAHEMLTLLTQGASADAEIEESEAYARQTQATPEDVSLAIPEDVNSELLDAYLQETPQHASDFSECIQNIIADPQVPEIEKAQRIAHTLKGSSNIIGIKGIANMGHHLEDTLEYLAQNQVTPPKELTDTMVEAADCIEMMVDSLTGQDEAPDNAQTVLQRVLDWANKIDKGDLTAPPAPSQSAAASGDADKPAEKKAEKKAAAPAAAGGAEGSMLRVPTRTVDELMRLVGELSISMGQIQERLKHVLGSTRTLIEENMTLQHKTFELETLVDVRGVTGVESHGYRDTEEEAENFDALEFEEYNELHTVAHSFIESIADNRELSISIRNDLAELETMLIQQERLNKEFQATITTTRMVPVSTMMSKLQRNVRQTCRATGKQAELEIEGGDILMDSDVLNKLGDPLQHILRNAIDHGLEAPDEREIMGKAATGQVVLSFYREGNNIVVSCQDDGQGLNYTNIRYTAIQRGLITESQELTEKELGRLILMSGFSTKAGVTQVSGRGVGMDVVHTSIRDMKGTLDIDSETGKGTLFTIKLPMTLVTVHVLIVRVGKSFYGIPTNTLIQAIASGLGEFQVVGEEITLRIEKSIYAVKSLGDLLGVPSDKPTIDENEDRPLVLVREEAGVTAVVVDELMDTHDLVMKNMGRYVTKVHGVAGASILGDGSLVPLLDVPELLRSPMQAAMSSYMNSQAPEDAAEAAMNALPHIMVVDDSMSVRKSLTLLLEDAGFETLTAKDGLEAIEVMNEKRPNVMLVDMEMPRMNGLELTAHVRANQATKDMPIFMITSRTTEKHREQAKTAGVSAYLTKPYQDIELLGLIDKALAAQR